MLNGTSNYIMLLFFFSIIAWALPSKNIENEISKTPESKIKNEDSVKKDDKSLKKIVIPKKALVVDSVTTTEDGEEKKDEIINIPIIYFSDFEGRFINVNKTQKGSYYNLLRRIKYYQNVLPMLNGWERTITLNNGASFWPSISVRYLLKKEKGIDLIYSLLNENHFDVINFGKKDFYTPYQIIEKLSDNKNILKLPFLSSNMDCRKNQNLPICKLTKNRKYRILNINNIKIGIISIVSKSVMHKAFYKNVEGITILPEAEEANRIAKYLKESKKVNIIILLAQVESKESSPRKTMLLSEELKNIDLIISNAKNTRLIRRYDNDVYIIGTNPKRYTPNLLLLQVKKINSQEDNKYNILNIVNLNKKYPYKADVPKYFKTVLDNYKKAYLKEYDVPINNMKIPSVSFKEFYSFILKLMIKKTNTEIAIINKENFDTSLFPIKVLTYDVIEKSISYNDKIVSFKMKGKLLKKFLKSYGNDLLFTNIEFGKKIKINGHEIIDKKNYEIATTEFIANGGDNFFKDSFFIKNKKYYPQIKTMFKKYLKKDKFKEKDSVFDANSEFEDFSKRFLWEFYGNLGMYYIRNDVSNDAQYDKSKFDSVPSELLKLDSKISLKGSSNYHIIDNVFELNYYQSKEDNTEFKESNDLITYSFNYKSNYFRVNAGNKFFIPLPFFESKLNSELTKPDTEDKHYFELFLSGGISFLTLSNKFEFKVGLRGSKDFRYSDSIESGTILGYSLDNYELDLDIPIKINSKLDYFLGFDNTNIMDFLIDVNIPILGYFHFSTKFDSYLYKEKDSDWASYYNIFFGINIIYNNWF